MLFSRSMNSRAQNKVEVRELDWSQVQSWFQQVFFAGEDLPTGQRTAEYMHEQGEGELCPIQYHSSTLPPCLYVDVPTPTPPYL